MELDLAPVIPNNSQFAEVGCAVRTAFLSIQGVHTRADLLQPQRVTSRWVGLRRNILVVPNAR